LGLDKLDVEEMYLLLVVFERMLFRVVLVALLVIMRGSVLLLRISAALTALSGSSLRKFQ